MRSVPDSIPRSAELAARENEIADELQASLLPAAVRPGLPRGGDVLPGGQAGTQVGGDWYDVLGLPDGRTALVVGDVMGRGVRAAAVMSQLRTVVRAYARMGVPPLELLGSLDHLVVRRASPSRS